jgi:hypothetical protein
LNNKQEGGYVVRKLALMLLVGVAGCSGGAEKTEAPAAKIELQPGQWEMTTQITELTINGASQASNASQPVTIKNCVTPEQVKQPDPKMFGDGKNSSCKYDNFYMSDGRINAGISCKGPDGSSTINSTINGQFTPTTMAIDMEMLSNMGGANMRMKAKLDAKRIGECATPPAGASKT